MTTFYLIRHGATDLVGKAIAGRLPGVHLNQEGQQQAERLSERLAKAPIKRIYSSPLERAQETATPLARRLGLEIHDSEALTEIGFGDWTGEEIDDLIADPRWQQWNSFRSGTRAPNGELMIETQARLAAFIERLRTEFPGDTMALFSHGDPIRAAILYYLGMPLDLLQRIDISPGSVSILRISDTGPEIHCLNQMY